jgi:hypothetical protein
MKILDNLRYHDEKYGGNWAMRWDQLYMALGLDPKRHLPAEGLGPQFVGNVLVWVDPKIPGRNQDAKRVWCRCPDCERVLTAWKLQQHRKIHKAKKEV